VYRDYSTSTTGTKRWYKTFQPEIHIVAQKCVPGSVIPVRTRSKRTLVGTLRRTSSTFTRGHKKHVKTRDWNFVEEGSYQHECVSVYQLSTLSTCTY
jgi:hypothetical protein